ncbi:pyruvate formate lyase activating enzyme [Thermotomaculum hydrothermale]|uniref:Pyruvate formate lyase activating enzyme n=1 Tax=Thermotomaculum hydrothermale TaxID=981385 RepID=A0A7R6PP20_9BACT|nr:anaerobic ribonucleoside-triphosphate reductase activating protein [Thermotomaculum hydrothermale]BBB31751.1 pyruvate formate lyase activating enzyme [Thermotomaculum hydrothermale]
MEKLHIGGITPFSTIDYPENLSAVFFFQGCVFRCPFCHNSEFQEVKKPYYSFEKFKKFVEERQGFLDAIVFSGGEPLLFDKELVFLAEDSKKSGFKVGLHTTGYSPERLKNLLDKKLIDWVGIDLKSVKENYPFACGIDRNYFDETVESINVLKQSGIEFEVRTTVFKEIANSDSLREILNLYSVLGIETPVFQVFSVDGKPDKEIELILEKFKLENNENFIIRK